MKKININKILEMVLSFSLGTVMMTQVGTLFSNITTPVFEMLLLAGFTTGGYFGLQQGKKVIANKYPEIAEILKSFLDFESFSDKEDIEVKPLNIIQKHTELKETEADAVKDYYATIGHYLYKNNLTLLNNNAIIEINLFLNFITNNNYFENERFKDKIIGLVLNKICFYLNEKEKMNISEEEKSNFVLGDVFQVMDRCFFIKDDLKSKILLEYFIFYRNKNEKMYEDKNVFNAKCVYNFNHKEKIYEAIIECITEENIFDEFGDCSKINWDFSSLAAVVTTILDSCDDDILGYENRQDAIYDVVFDFIYNAGCYALLNNKNNVGNQELIGTLKNWNSDFSYSEKLEIINELSSKEESKKHHHKILKLKKPTKKANVE